MSEPNGPRSNTLEWEDYCMAVALLTAKQSKDPNTQVGACIVSDDNKIMGVGCNNMPDGCNAESLPWDRDTKDILKSKYTFICHAELNAILHKNSADMKGCTLYVTLFPCNECAKVIIQSKIKEVVYLTNKYPKDAKYVASKKLLEEANIPCYAYREYRKSALDIENIILTMKPEQEDGD